MTPSTCDTWFFHPNVGGLEVRKLHEKFYPNVFSKKKCPALWHVVQQRKICVLFKMRFWKDLQNEDTNKLRKHHENLASHLLYQIKRTKSSNTFPSKRPSWISSTGQWPRNTENPDKTNIGNSKANTYNPFKCFCFWYFLSKQCSSRKVAPLGWGSLHNQPHIHHILNGSNREVKQLEALHPRGFPSPSRPRGQRVLRLQFWALQPMSHSSRCATSRQQQQTRRPLGKKRIQGAKVQYSRVYGNTLNVLGICLRIYIYNICACIYIYRYSIYKIRTVLHSYY